jgi:hypothetical protein
MNGRMVSNKLAQHLGMFVGPWSDVISGHPTLMRMHAASMPPPCPALSPALPRPFCPKKPRASYPRILDDYIGWWHPRILDGYIGWWDPWILDDYIGWWDPRILDDYIGWWDPRILDDYIGWWDPRILDDYIGWFHHLWFSDQGLRE